jgi:hypothetical protein
MTQAKLTLPITATLPFAVNSPQDAAAGTTMGYLHLPQ